MAYIVEDESGFKVCYRDGAKKIRSIRIGKDATKETAAEFSLWMGRLNASKMAGSEPSPKALQWLAGLSSTHHEKLADLGLAEPRPESLIVTLGGMLADFFASMDVKPATKIRMKQAKKSLVDHFGEDRDLATISETDAEEWRAKLKKDKYAGATISRTVLYARQMFRWAIRRGKANTNPFASIKAGAQTNPDRQAFIDRETIAKVMAAAPDDEWRLLIALSRYGGLRVPSEALILRWGDVDFDNNRIVVRSPKTEHHEGKGERTVPMFPELRPLLKAAYDAHACNGEVFVIRSYREGQNLNPQLRRIIKDAGISPWEKAWHNMRASRQTELVAAHPLTTACEWMGNSKIIAAGHYCQVTDADWMRAIGEGGLIPGAAAAPSQPLQPPNGVGSTGGSKGGLQVSATTGSDRKESSEVSADAALIPNGADGLRDVQGGQVGRAGLEPATPAFSMRCSTN